MLQAWKTLATELLESVPIFRVFRKRRQSPDTGCVGDFYVMDLPDWVNVVALTEDDELVLVRQYRHGTDEVTLEIPGGNVDPGETYEEAAARELREETGFVADEWARIGTVEPNPAFMNNRCATYLGRGAVRRHEPRLDEHEEIEVVLIDRDDFEPYIDAGRITHALVVAAAYHLRQWEEKAG